MRSNKNLIWLKTFLKKGRKGAKNGRNWERQRKKEKGDICMGSEKEEETCTHILSSDNQLYLLFISRVEI